MCSYTNTLYLSIVTLIFGNSDYVKTENRIFKDIEDEIENIDKALKNIMYYYFDFEKDMNMIYKYHTCCV